ncbi:hypothetical protein YC2023_108173 [Brassica napus]
MVPESDGLILRILPDGRRVLTRLIRGGEPSVCRLIRGLSVTGSGALSMPSVLSVLDGWLETKPSLFVYLGHVVMVG